MKNKGISRKRLEEDIKRGIFYSENCTTCKHCGHRVMVGRTGKIICSWCKYYVFRDEKDEFLYRLSEAKRREMV